MSQRSGQCRQWRDSATQAVPFRCTFVAALRAVVVHRIKLLLHGRVLCEGKFCRLVVKAILLSCHRMKLLSGW